MEWKEPLRQDCDMADDQQTARRWTAGDCRLCSTLASAALLTSILLYNGALGQVERGQLLRVSRYLARYVRWR